MPHPKYYVCDLFLVHHWLGEYGSIFSNECNNHRFYALSIFLFFDFFFLLCANNLNFYFCCQIRSHPSNWKSLQTIVDCLMYSIQLGSLEGKITFSNLRFFFLMNTFLFTSCFHLRLSFCRLDNKSPTSRCDKQNNCTQHVIYAIIKRVFWLSG